MKDIIESQKQHIEDAMNAPGVDVSAARVYHDALVAWLETSGWSYIAGVLKGEFTMPEHMPPPPKPE